MHLYIRLSFALLLLLALAACEKEPPPAVSTGDGTYEKLTRHSWQLIEAYTNSQKDGVLATENHYANMDSCEMDDLITFNTDSNAIVVDQGKNKCYPGEPQTSVSQKWALNGESYVAYFDIGTENMYEAAIIELSETTYHIRRYGTLTDGTYFETTHRYVAR